VASELPSGQNIRRPDLADHAATRLAQLSNIGGGATVRLSTAGDDEGDDDEEVPETKPATESRRVAPPWAVVDSDRSFVGNGKQLGLMHLFSSGITTVLFGTVKKLKNSAEKNSK